MDVLRYRRRALYGDYARSALGIGVAGIPLSTVDVGGTGIWVLGSLALLFGLFGARTALRHRTAVRVDGTGVTAKGLTTRSIEWRNLASVKLSYYTTRRDGASGWMQLKLGDGHTTVRLESTLDGFRQVVECAGRAAMARGVHLAPKTTSNMRALGLAVRGTESPVVANGRSPDRP